MRAPAPRQSDRAPLGGPFEQSAMGSTPVSLVAHFVSKEEPRKGEMDRRCHGRHGRQTSIPDEDSRRSWLGHEYDLLLGLIECQARARPLRREAFPVDTLADPDRPRP